MGDDAATVEQLRAELRQLRERYVVAEAKVDSLLADAERRDRTLAEALEQQAATAEVLRVIASAPTDLQQVLHRLTVSATRLCGADGGSLFKADGEEVMVLTSTDPWRAGRRQPLAETLTGRVLLEARTVHIHGS